MKNPFLPLIALFLFVFQIGLAQNECNNASCLTNSVIISTGYNHVTNSAYADKEQDPYWILVNAPTNVVVNLNGPANVIASDWGTPIEIKSKYISAFESSGSNKSNIDPPANPYSFERCFCVCGENVTLNYNFIARADNRVKFYIDGTLLPGQPDNLMNSTSQENFDGNDVNNKIQGSIKLNAGRHCLRAELRNDNEGSLMGLNISGTISTSGNNLMKTNCCSNTGFITGYKINDKNCNGIKDIGELALPNWKIEVSGNGISKSMLTDANGYYAFSVPAGTYTISEVMQASWRPTSPVGGSQSSVVVGSNAIVRIDFLNCDKPSTSTVCCPELPNLIVNPDFEKKDGPRGYTSAYTHDGGALSENSLLPGEQTIVSTSNASQICSQWAMKSICAGNFLLTNGANNQTTAPKLVWQQTVNNVKGGIDYKFCAKFFRLRNCCFLVSPKIDIKFSVPGYDLLAQAIDDPNKPLVCDFWRQIDKVVTVPNGTTSVTIQIFLHESAAGDGNDIGIDDIGFVGLPKTPDTKTYFDIAHSSNTGFKATVVDKNLKDCGIWWKVCECDDKNICKPNATIENPAQWWTYPTPLQFPGYNGTNALSGTGPGVFDKTKRYKIELGVWCPCSSWNSNAYIWNPTSKSFVKENPKKD